ncbi:MAG TPA: TusE/DsrC/DsvC family sulfur relay protein [Usitatibacter sp.]|nr:TusE/DsrC/DsvC family sulfur relay protein [Usitatibacter sp.]
MQPESGPPAPVLDEDGYLVDPDAWTEDLARMLAKREGIELTGEHWDVIRFMRAFYEERRIAPDARYVLRHLAESRGADRNELFRLFPYGYPKQACKIAGMRKPRVWSTG